MLKWGKKEAERSCFSTFATAEDEVGGEVVMERRRMEEKGCVVKGVVNMPGLDEVVVVGDMLVMWGKVNSKSQWQCVRKRRKVIYRKMQKNHTGG